MNFQKLVLGFKPIQRTPIWWWFRLINHRHFQLSDYYIWKEFWLSINRGYDYMQYKYEFEKVWGEGAKPEVIILSQENFDALVEKLNSPPDPKSVERFREIMNKKPPWNEE